MTTMLLTPAIATDLAIRLVVDRDAAYVESHLGRQLTAVILREIADDLDPRRGRK